MKVFIVLSAMLVCATARPGFLHAPLTYVSTPVHLATSSQYHTQDSLGQYVYGYADPFSAKSEARSVDGITTGGYSYVDSNGQVQNVQYTADDVNGFQVAASNLPVAPKEEAKPVEDTPEVAKAKSEHLAAVEEVKARDAAAPADDSEAVEVGSDDGSAYETPLKVQTPYYLHYASPAVSYYSYPAVHQTYSAVHGYAVAPAVHSYGYSGLGYGYGYAPFVYSNGHAASELPADDDAVAKAKAEHAAAHQEVKARLAAAGVAVH